MSKDQISETPEKSIRLGISHGDINGIGYEVIIKTFADPRMMTNCTPIVYGSSKVASYHRKTLNLHDFNFNLIRRVDAANSKRANIINITEEEVKIELGVSTEIAGKMALLSLEAAINDLKQGFIDVLVTAPINKHNIQSEGFSFPGHTEYLGNAFGVKDPLMLLVSDKLRVGLASGHIPLAEVPGSLNLGMIVEKLKLMSHALFLDFGIRAPKIAVLGLNPHSGDTGLIGREETDIIIPAINKAKEDGINAFGPYAADGFFGASEFSKFDAVLAMYHDQGLIAFKNFSFENGVNFTAGLPVIRTSPDHGTGYDIAGKNMASPDSFRAAVFAACDIFKQRSLNKELLKNPLQKTNLDMSAEELNIQSNAD